MARSCKTRQHGAWMRIHHKDCLAIVNTVAAWNRKRSTEERSLCDCRPDVWHDDGAPDAERRRPAAEGAPVLQCRQLLRHRWGH